MSGSGIGDLTPQEFYQAIQAVRQRDERATEKASRATSRSQPDTTADQTDAVPGRDVDLASFANVSYVPSALTWQSRTNPDGSISRLRVVSARVIGWQANYGSANAEDTLVKAQAPDLFSGSFIGWGNYSG